MKNQIDGSCEIRFVLGIDLASKSWTDTGSAVLSFQAGDSPAWESIDYGCIAWPKLEVAPKAMADVIDKFARKNSVHAVSMDGPQGWREPEAGDRKGVGRWCEYEAKCQGKTGRIDGQCFPNQQRSWMAFCIEVFGELIRTGRAEPVNEPEARALEPLGGGRYWLLECNPTSIWKTSGLKPLPGKRKVGKNPEEMASWARVLGERYGIPGLEKWQGSHDDLQAVVAALPGASLLGGPCKPHSRGKSGWQVESKGNAPRHRVEGLIWDCAPEGS